MSRKQQDTKKSELLEELARAARMQDCEDAHIRADQLLVEYIDDQEITDAYESVGKWYA